MRAFEYNSSGEYIGETILQESPLEKGVFFNRPNTTRTKPDIVPGKCPVFVGGVWTQKTDARGKIYYRTDDARPVTIAELGGELDAALTNEKPCEFPKWDGSKWVIDAEKKTATENAAVAANLAAIDAGSVRALRACVVAIINGQQPPKADADALKTKEAAAVAERVKIK